MNLLPWYIPAGAAAVITGVIALGAHSLDVNRLEKNWQTKENAAVQAQANLCEKSKQPANEANDDSETKTKQLLTTCIERLRKPTKCIPVRLPTATGGAETANRQEASGITSTELEANNLECQKDRNDLNAAKLWAIGYSKFITQLRN